MCKIVSQHIGEQNVEFIKFSGVTFAKATQCAIVAAIFTRVDPGAAFLIGGMATIIKKTTAPLFEKILPENTSYMRLAKGTIKVLHSAFAYGGSFLIARAIYTISIESAAFFYLFGSYIPSLILLGGCQAVRVAYNKVTSDIRYFYEHPEITSRA